MNKYFINALYPISYSVNIFSFTFLLLVLGITKNYSLVTTIALTQSFFVLFFSSLSGNLRNKILSGLRVDIYQYLKFRLAAIALIASTSILFSNYLSTIILAITLRKCSEWLEELLIISIESSKRHNLILIFLLFQLLSLYLATLFLSWFDDALIFLIWSLISFLVTFLFFRFKKIIRYKKNTSFIIEKIDFFDLTGSFIANLANLIFRYILYRTQGAYTSGILISGFAIGGLYSTISSVLFLPTIINRSNLFSKFFLNLFTKFNRVILYTMPIVIAYLLFSNLGISRNLFYLSLSYSFLGSAFMFKAQLIKLTFISQKYKSLTLLRSELIIGILICFFAYISSLSLFSDFFSPTLFLISSLINFTVYRLLLTNKIYIYK